jgi:hypothetical protein
MKVLISEFELWPCFSIKKKADTTATFADYEIDVDEETYHKWRQISDKFHDMQEEIRRAIRAYEFKQEEINHLKECFKHEQPSRVNKGYILSKFGWTQVDTSVWEKNGRQERLHVAYDECKKEFLEKHNEQV